jgi:hypothetical protein
MAHGMYKIKVVNMRGNVLFEYAACTHPIANQVLEDPDGTPYIVSMVTHKLRNDNNGYQQYIGFLHVEIQVC